MISTLEENTTHITQLEREIILLKKLLSDIEIK